MVLQLHGVSGDKLLELLHRLVGSLQVTRGFSEVSGRGFPEVSGWGFPEVSGQSLSEISRQGFFEVSIVTLTAVL